MSDPKEYAIYARTGNGTLRMTVVSAESPEAAAQQALSSCSVWDLYKGGGVTVRVFEVGDEVATFFARYDGEPLTEAHGSTGAKLVVERR